jgi:hypothetical protein
MGHLIPAVTHGDIQLRAIIGSQSAQVRKLTGAYQHVAVTHCAIGVVDGVAGLELSFVGHRVLRACHNRGQNDDAEGDGGSSAPTQTLHTLPLNTGRGSTRTSCLSGSMIDAPTTVLKRSSALASSGHRGA